MSGAMGAAPSVQLAPEAAKKTTDLPKLVLIVVKGGKTTASETVGFYLGLKAGDAVRRRLLALLGCWTQAS